MLTNLDYNFEKMRKDYESGKIKQNNLTDEEKAKLIEYYKSEIESNEKEITETKNKIKAIKNKIDNMV